MARPRLSGAGLAPLSRRRAAVFGIGAMAIVVAAGFALLGSGRAPGPTGARGSGPPGLGPGASPGDEVAASHPPPGHEVYGFVPYWEMDDTIAAHLGRSDATTIGLFSVTHGTKGVLNAKLVGYRRITGPIGRRIIADAHDRERRVEVTYTSFGRAKNEALFDSVPIQDRVIDGLVELRRTLRVDGVAVDVEELDDTAIPAYGAFIGRLREALRKDHPAATVTVTTGAGRQGVALALVATLAGADRIFLMGYDYRTGASEPGATSPLGPGRRDGDERTLAWSLDLYAGAGIPPERTILGLPLYGVAWPVASADLGAAATGKGKVWVPRQNLATLHNPGIVPGYDASEDVAFLAVPDGATWRAVYYDTPQSLTPKLRLADDRGLAGAGLWALGYDRGLPDYTKLMKDFHAGRLPAIAP